ncbi:MAG: NADH-quinone oxidoreductase subunit J, partial [Alphaproteobacteria bacterium]
ISNTEALGLVLYTKYVYLFQGAGLILLVAMIGAIVLTLRRREGVRRQRIGQQLERDPKRTIEIRKVPVGGGIR